MSYQGKTRYLQKVIYSIKLFPKWPDTVQQYIFVKGMNQNGLKPEQYVQALVGAGAIQLYRSDIKQVTEMSEINVGMIKTFANTSRYYIKKGNELKLIKLNKDEMMPFLIDKEAAVNAVIETKRLSLKKELDIKKKWYLFWTQTHRTGLHQNQKTPITM